jgi:hypothetical protein
MPGAPEAIGVLFDSMPTASSDQTGRDAFLRR